VRAIEGRLATIQADLALVKRLVGAKIALSLAALLLLLLRDTVA
jgi:hypothetical protein